MQYLKKEEVSYIFLAFTNNMARSLATIVDSIKKILELVRIVKIYKSISGFKDFC